ncbi:hypothetical protein [Dinoroseobacter sp. S375]|uniref:hypothetical protein n=1 Tax=Dinoroseobacter sp. S375 TaxID=3415136 RepID=UPI003C7E4A40
MRPWRADNSGKRSGIALFSRFKLIISLRKAASLDTVFASDGIDRADIDRRDMSRKMRLTATRSIGPGPHHDQHNLREMPQKASLAAHAAVTFAALQYFDGLLRCGFEISED